MTEAEWLLCTDIEKMVHQLRTLKRVPSLRKQRLCAVACCRRISQHLDIRYRTVIDMTEKYADGQASLTELRAAREAAEQVIGESFTFVSMLLFRRRYSDISAIARWTWEATVSACWPAKPSLKRIADAVGWCVSVATGQVDHGENAAQAQLLRDVFGDPFREPSNLPGWRSWDGGTIAALAREIYSDRAFDRLPILADALEEAGCTDAAILKHCRGPGPHVRGCWVVDLLLGKE